MLPGSRKVGRFQKPAFEPVDYCGLLETYHISKSEKPAQARTALGRPWVGSDAETTGAAPTRLGEVRVDFAYRKISVFSSVDSSWEGLCRRARRPYSLLSDLQIERVGHIVESSKA